MSSVLPTTGTSTGNSTSSLANLGQGVVSSLASQGTVSSTGLGSGLDINSIVKQLVGAEGTPQQTLLSDKQTRIQTQISAYGQLQAGISGLQAALAELSTPQQFEGTTVTVGDPTVASATTNSSATAGSYNLLVKQLASGEKLVSTPVASSTTAVGTGTLTIKVGSNAFNVTIDSTNNTLAGIAGAINSAAAGTGVSAALVTSNTGVSLVLNSATTGAANAVTVTQTGGNGGLASLVYDPANSNTKLTLAQGAQDAIVQLDGNTYNSSSNVVTGLLTGVTLTLTGASAGTTTTALTITGDNSGAQTAVQTFIAAYNSLVQTVTSLSSYNASTNTGGPLLGDPLLTNLRSQINQIIDSTAKMPAGSPFNSLAQIGIVANPDGTLSANSSRLTTAFTNSFSAVAQLFAGNGGIANSLNNALTQFTQPAGVLDQENKTLKQGLTDIANQTTKLNQHLATLQATLLAQYNAMDALVAQLKQTGTALTTQLNAIYFPGEANTPVP
jgi:flagellar hook-associated protein 2